MHCKKHKSDISSTKFKEKSTVARIKHVSVRRYAIEAPQTQWISLTQNQTLTLTLTTHIKRVSVLRRGTEAPPTLALTQTKTLTLAQTQNLTLT